MNEAIQIQEPQHQACFIPRVNAQPFFHGSLFSGIGGFDLAAEWAGWQNAFHCEWNEFGQKILKYGLQMSAIFINFVIWVKK